MCECGEECAEDTKNSRLVMLRGDLVHARKRVTFLLSSSSFALSLSTLSAKILGEIVSPTPEMATLGLSKVFILD
ncbi:myosin-I heavy chain, partial [Vespula maculifrons]